MQGLANENKRWNENVQTLTEMKLSCIGDTLLGAEFVSYIGPFTSKFRLKLWKDLWIPDII